MLAILTRLLGPICAKEMIEQARRRRFYIERTVIALIAALAVMFTWQTTHISYTDVVRADLMADFAKELFVAIGTIQLLCVGVLIPPLTASLISGEREAHTLDTLLSTPLSNRQIIGGKFISRIAVFGGWLLCSLGVQAALLLCGGIEGWDLVRLQSASLLLLWFCGSITTYFSVRSQSPLETLLRAYPALVIYLLLLPFCVAILDHGSQYPSPALKFFVFANPVFISIMAIDSRPRMDLIGHYGSHFFPLTFVVPVVLGLLALVLSGFKLREVVHHAQNSFNLSILRRGLSTPHLDLPLSNSNPLWWRAWCAWPYDRGAYLRRAYWVIGMVAMFVWFITGIEKVPEDMRRQAHLVVCGAVMLIVAVLAGLVSASSVVGDRRRGFLEQLCITPLSEREIVDGVYGAVAVHLLPGAMLFIAAAVLLWWANLLTIVGAAGLALGGLVWLTTIIAFCVACSFAASKAHQSLIPALGWVFLMITLPDLVNETLKWTAWVTVCVGVAILLPIGRWYVKHRLSATVTGSYQFLVHVALLLVATSWIKFWSVRGYEVPLVMLSPWWWFEAILSTCNGPEFYTNWSVFPPVYSSTPATMIPGTPVPILLVYGLYLVALLVHAWYLRRWTIRNFYRLIEAGR